MVHCARALFGTTARHRHARRALARLQFEQRPPQTLPTPPFIMPTIHFILQTTLRIVRQGQGLLARVVDMRLYAWARPILIEAGAELLARGQVFVVEWAAR